jgi:acetate kinase
MTVEKLGWLGAKLDGAANARNAEIISTGDSKLAMLVIPTNEEEMIARHTLSCIA